MNAPHMLHEQLWKAILFAANQALRQARLGLAAAPPEYQPRIDWRGVFKIDNTHAEFDAKDNQ